MIVMIHKECSGPAMETQIVIGEVCTIPANQFPLTCFTCLEEILDESEVRYSEQIGM